MLQFQNAKLVSFTILATLLKLTSDIILHYLRSADLSESFSELIVSTFIFHNIFSIDFSQWKKLFTVDGVNIYLVIIYQYSLYFFQ